MRVLKKPLCLSGAICHSSLYSLCDRSATFFALRLLPRDLQLIYRIFMRPTNHFEANIHCYPFLDTTLLNSQHNACDGDAPTSRSSCSGRSLRQMLRMFHVKGAVSFSPVPNAIFIVVLLTLRRSCSTSTAMDMSRGCVLFFSSSSFSLLVGSSSALVVVVVVVVFLIVIS